MTGWVRYTRNTLVYAGRITRTPFSAWVETSEGRQSIDAIASRIRFRLLPKARIARRRLWRRLAAAVRDEAVAAAIQEEVRTYLARLGELAYAAGLPTTGISLHRLVVVPRVLLNAAAYRSIERKLELQPAFSSPEDREGICVFFCQQLVEQMEMAVAGARPSIKRPLPTGTEWMSVGLNAAFVWRPPIFEWPLWNGHHYLLEMTRYPVTRAVRQAAAVAIHRFETSLPLLSREERNQILRRASGHG